MVLYHLQLLYIPQFNVQLLFDRCEPEKHFGDMCSPYHSPTSYQMAITNESRFEIWRQLLKTYHSTSLTGSDSKCKEFFAFTLCFYLFRSCELDNVSDSTASGFQLTICKEKCADVDKLYQECTSKINVQTALGNAQIEVLQNLVSRAKKFECSNPDTYTIPQVPVSNRSCDDVSYLNYLFSSEGK